MRLAPGRRNLDEIAGGKPPRLRQHRSRNLDVLVPRQAPDRLDRRIVDRSKPFAELDQGFALDPADQKAQYIVEDFDLIVVQSIGVVEEEVGNPPQRVGPVFQGVVLDRQFEFGEERLTNWGHGNVSEAQVISIHHKAGDNSNDGRNRVEISPS
jgi:hypothetical protein